ncbi:hypothetical protein GCM10010324_16270 [Streptomyces hiroshimensis]|uniref:Uncharacterized protein n=1 Tax=Streptomyces hiroshimensis TaxID=66424 RepID=A0ABQ2Y8B5_9ACTN|nr:hypothetical protein GCM10010324_16270 [Streptomyces hiroshimensis]
MTVGKRSFGSFGRCGSFGRGRGVRAVRGAPVTPPGAFVGMLPGVRAVGGRPGVQAAAG